MAYKILDKALQGNATTLRSAPCFSKPNPPNISRFPGLSPQACSNSPPSSLGREGARLKSQQVSASPFLPGQEANAGASCHSLSPPSGSGRRGRRPSHSLRPPRAGGLGRYLCYQLLSQSRRLEPMIQTSPSPTSFPPTPPPPSGFMDSWVLLSTGPETLTPICCPSLLPSQLRVAGWDNSKETEEVKPGLKEFRVGPRRWQFGYLDLHAHPT